MPRMVSIRHGRAGEYLACYLLEMAGIETFRVDGSFDLIAHSSQGELVRVEVKSATPNKQIHGGTYKFSRPRATLLADYYCLMALDLGLMRIIRGSLWRDRKTISMTKNKFTRALQQADLRWLKRDLTNR